MKRKAESVFSLAMSYHIPISSLLSSYFPSVLPPMYLLNTAMNLMSNVYSSRADPGKAGSPNAIWCILGL